MASKARSRGFIDVQLVGGKELRAGLLALGPDGMQASVIQPSLHEGGEILLSAVKQGVPVGETGRLLESARLFLSKTRARVAVGNRAKGGAYYGHFLEYGTKKMRARPFMRPAMDGNRRRIEGIFVRHLKATVAKIGAGGFVASTGGRGRWKRSKAA